MLGPVDWKSLSSYEMGVVLGSVIDHTDTSLILTHFEQLTQERCLHTLAPSLKAAFMRRMDRELPERVRMPNRPRCAALLPLFDGIVQKGTS